MSLVLASPYLCGVYSSSRPLQWLWINTWASYVIISLKKILNLRIRPNVIIMILYLRYGKCSRHHEDGVHSNPGASKLATPHMHELFFFRIVMKIYIDAIFLSLPIHTTSLVATTISYSSHKFVPAPSRITQGNTKQSKVYYKVRAEDFVIFAADIITVQNWKQDHSIPLAQVMDGWKIFTSHQ